MPFRLQQLIFNGAFCGVVVKVCAAVLIFVFFMLLSCLALDFLTIHGDVIKQ
jgi:hypothetical protein